MSAEAIKTALDIAAELCIHFEGYSATPYLCPAGYWTIGYGTVYKPDGSRVTKDHPAITKAIALRWLMYELEHNYMRAVLSATPNVVRYPRVLGALTDFAYNLGGARYRASTLAKRVREENWKAAVVQLKLWNKGGGRVLAGLVRRRQAEAQYFPHA
jgi:lysozyme